MANPTTGTWCRFRRRPDPHALFRGFEVSYAEYSPGVRSGEIVHERSRKHRDRAMEVFVGGIPRPDPAVPKG